MLMHNPTIFIDKLIGITILFHSHRNQWISFRSKNAT